MTGPIISKTLPTTFRFSSTTSEPSLGVFSALTITFREGDTFDTLPNLCKRPFPSRKHVRQRTCTFKAFWMVIDLKYKYAFYRRKIIKHEVWIRLCLNKGEAKKYVKTILCKI